jgi:organic radical activating enzyme
MTEYQTYALSSITLQNVEKVPLAFCAPGGLAISLIFIECPLQCEECPWEAHLSRRSAVTLNIDHAQILDLIHRFSPDIVMLHGGEPYNQRNVKKLIETLRKHIHSCIGIKANIPFVFSSLDNFNEILQHIDLILFEVTDKIAEHYLIKENDLKVVRSFLEKLYDYGKQIEFVAVIKNENSIDPIIRFVSSLSETLTRFLIPFNIIFSENISFDKKINIVDSIRKLNVIVQAPLEPSTELASTFCVSCKNPIIVRQGGFLIRGAVDQGKCKYCGFRYTNIRPAKRIMKRPIELQLM